MANSERLNRTVLDVARTALFEPQHTVSFSSRLAEAIIFRELHGEPTVLFSSEWNRGNAL